MSLNYPQDHQIYIFSSHAWKHLHRRDALTGLISARWIKGEDFFDLSVTPRHPIDAECDPELAYALRERVRVCDALLVTAGMFINDKPWIKFEIDMAFALDRPIIPVIFNGQERVPKVARQFAWCDPVKWRGDGIREAILRFLPPLRREVFEAKIARREATRAEAHRSAARAAFAYANRRPGAGSAARGLRGLSTLPLIVGNRAADNYGAPPLVNGRRAADVYGLPPPAHAPRLLPRK